MPNFKRINPALSFKPKVLFVTKDTIPSYKLTTDLKELGLLLSRDGKEIHFDLNEGVIFTEGDKKFIKDEFRKEFFPLLPSHI